MDSRLKYRRPQGAPTFRRTRFAHASVANTAPGHAGNNGRLDQSGHQLQGYKEEKGNVVDTTSLDVDGEQSAAVLSRWKSSFGDDERHFASVALQVELTLKEVSLATAHLRSPNALRTAVVCDLFERLCANSFGRYKGPLDQIRQELFKSIFVDYDQLRQSQGSDESTVYEMVPFFSKWSRAQDRVLRLNQALHLYRVSEKDLSRSQRVLANAARRWRLSVEYQCFGRWKAWCRNRTMMRRIVIRLLQKAANGFSLRSRFHLWQRYVSHQKNSRVRKELYGGRLTASEMHSSAEAQEREITQLRLQNHNMGLELRTLRDERRAQQVSEVQIHSHYQAASLRSLELILLRRLENLKHMASAFLDHGLDWVDPHTVLSMFSPNASLAEKGDDEAAVKDTALRAVRSLSARHFILHWARSRMSHAALICDRDDVASADEAQSFSKEERRAIRLVFESGENNPTDLSTSWRTGRALLLLIALVFPDELELQDTLLPSAVQRANAVAKCLNRVTSKLADTKFIVESTDISDPQEPVITWILCFIVSQDPTLRLNRLLGSGGIAGQCTARIVYKFVAQIDELYLRAKKFDGRVDSEFASHESELLSLLEEAEIIGLQVVDTFSFISNLHVEFTNKLSEIRNTALDLIFVKARASATPRNADAFCSISTSLREGCADDPGEVKAVDGVLQSISSELMSIFQFYTSGRETLGQGGFLNMCKDCKMLSASFSRADLDLVWRQCTRNLSPPCDEVEPAGFVAALVRISDLRFGGSELPLATKLEQLHREYLVLAGRPQHGSFRWMLLKNEPYTQLIYRYKTPLLTIFRFCADRSSAHTSQTRCCLSLSDFTTVLTEDVKVPLPVATIESVYRNVRQDSENESSSDDGITFAEFQEALAAVSCHLSPDPFRDVSSKMLTFLTLQLGPTLSPIISGLEAQFAKIKQEM